MVQSSVFDVPGYSTFGCQLNMQKHMIGVIMPTEEEPQARMQGFQKTEGVGGFVRAISLKNRILRWKY